MIQSGFEPETYCLEGKPLYFQKSFKSVFYMFLFKKYCIKIAFLIAKNRAFQYLSNAFLGKNKTNFQKNYPFSLITTSKFSKTSISAKLEIR